MLKTNHPHSRPTNTTLLSMSELKQVIHLTQTADLFLIYEHILVSSQGEVTVMKHCSSIGLSVGEWNVCCQYKVLRSHSVLGLREKHKNDRKQHLAFLMAFMLM